MILRGSRDKYHGKLQHRVVILWYYVLYTMVYRGKHWNTLYYTMLYWCLPRYTMV